MPSCLLIGALQVAVSWQQYFYPTVQRIERVQNAALLDAYNRFCTAQGVSASTCVRR